MSEFEITLAGRSETLRCTLKAARRVNQIGSFVDVARRLSSFDLDAYVAVVAAGLDRKPSEVEEAVYSTGMVKLNEPVSSFVTALANGGKPIDEAAKDEGTGES